MDAKAWLEAGLLLEAALEEQRAVVRSEVGAADSGGAWNHLSALARTYRDLFSRPWCSLLRYRPDLGVAVAHA